MNLERVSELLGLSDWAIKLEQATGDVHGECEALPERKEATVYIHPLVLDWEGTAIHELLHVILWEFSTYANLLATTETETECLRVAEERVVDHLQRAFQGGE